MAVAIHRPAQRPHVAVSSAQLSRLPVAFERNVGQAPAATKFVAHQPSYSLLVGAASSTMVLTRTQQQHATPGVPRAKTQAAALTLRTLGSNPAATVTGRSKLPGHVNYVVGNNRAKWHTGIDTFAAVHVNDVYPGVDLSYTGRHSQIEYSFALGAGVDPSTIRLGVDGARSLRVDRNGDLVAQTAVGPVVQRAPVAYQTVGGKRQDVRARFVLRGSEVSFALTGYDRSQPLTIDPTITFSSYLGSFAYAQAFGVQYDTNGDIFVSGYASLGLLDASNSFGGGNLDAFVMELDPTGSSVLYSTYVGGDGDDEATSLALDSSGDAYLAGFSNSDDFPVQGSAIGNGTGKFSAFVTELDPAGDAPVYSRLIGPSLTADTEAEAIAVGSDGAAYVTGLTNSTGLPATGNAFQPTNPNAQAVHWSAFVAKLDSSGSGAIDYLTYLGGKTSTSAPAALTEGLGIAVSSGGNAYVTGLTLASDFPTTGGAYTTTYGSQYAAAFVTELSADASSLVYSSFLRTGTGGKVANGTSIQVTGDGKIVVAGTTNAGTYPTTAGAYQTSYGGGTSDAFLTELDPNAADQLVYSTLLGGDEADAAEALVLDPDGDAHVAGITSSDDFPEVDTFASKDGPPDNSNAFVAKLDPSQSGSASLVYSSYLGASGSGDEASGIAFGPTGGVTVVGITGSTSFPTVNPLQQNFEASAAFVTTIAEVPDAPTGVAAVAGHEDASVSWTAPALDGGSAITHYTVTASPGGATLQGTSPLDFTGLTNGTAYTFTVVATNTAGDGPASSASSQVTPTGVPDAPTGVSATAGDQKATVSWTAPNDRGASITAYTVTASPGGATMLGDSPLDFTGLTNGVAYTFTVVATNSEGDSAASSPSSPVTPAAVPDAPADVTATAEPASADVSFAAPADNGSAISGYTVTSSPGGVTGTGSASPITVNGLTPGTSYTFTVVATNGVGDGTASDPSAGVTALSVNGSGTASTTAGSVSASSAHHTIALTYHAATGGTRSGAVTVAVPSGWSAPSLTGADAGFTTANAGTVSVSGQTITVSDLTKSGGGTVTITYGSRASSGPGATAPAATGAQHWNVREKSAPGGALTMLAASPSITVYAHDGGGTLTTGTATARAGSPGHSITFTYKAPTGGLGGGGVEIAVPSGWSAPATSDAAPGDTTTNVGTVSISGRTIVVSGVTLAAGHSLSITYGSTTGGGPGATAPAGGVHVWTASERSTPSGVYTHLASSPSIDVLAADGSGTMTASPTAVGHSSTGRTITFTYHVATGGVSSGGLTLVVPSGWSAPSTTGSARGYVTTTAGTISVTGSTIRVNGLTLAGGATVKVVYGSRVAFGPGASAPAGTGTKAWHAAERSSGAGTLTALSSSPSISVT